MIYLSNNDTVKFWGWINMLINSNSFILVFFTITLVITFICFYFFKSFGFKPYNSILTGVVLSFFAFFTIVVNQSSDITHYSFDNAKQAYTTNKDAFVGYEKFSNKLNNKGDIIWR